MEEINLERERERFCLSAKGMTHLLPADRRKDRWMEEWRRWTEGQKRVMKMGERCVCLGG